MRANELNYNLPKCLIAQYPVKPRDRARLMALNRGEGQIFHSIFYRLGDFLQQEDVLVANDSKVFPARLFGYKETQGKVQVLLLRRLPMEGEVWESLRERRISLLRLMVTFGS
jgi:S-adenosylmethionine:tRNA ribosyltransferase-isomerase